MTDSELVIHGFGDVEVDVDRHELRRGGQLIDVQPQVFSVLVYLVEHHDRVVTKIELLDAVWQHRFVTESALTSRIKSARQVIGDNGRDQRLIRTVHGRGYRFVGSLVGEGAPGASHPRVHGTPNDDAVLVGSPLDAAVEVLQHGRGAALAVLEPGPGPSASLELLRDRAASAGYPAGLGSARRAGMRTYGCVADAIDEILHRDPALLDELPPGCRHELQMAIAGQPVSGRQRLHLSVRELLVHAAERRGGVLLALDHFNLADAETVALITHLGHLGERYPIITAIAHPPGHDPVPGFETVVGQVHEGAAAASVEPVAHRLGDLPDDAVEALRLLALLDDPFDISIVEIALGADRSTCLRLLDLVVTAGTLEHTADEAFRFARIDQLAELTDGVARHRLAAMHALLGERFARSGAPPRRVAHHFLAAGQPASAVPAVIRIAGEAAAAELHREVLAWTERVLPHAGSDDRGALLALRAESLTAMGDPSATQVYRDAIRSSPTSETPGLRAGLARAALLSGDLEGARDALEGLEPTGGPHDGAIALARGMLAYFEGDLDTADRAADSARALALAPGAPTRLLDVITLQGMIAHNRGEWSDRLFRELRTSGDSPEIVATVFDCHLCVAEYMLYGPTPYDEVVALAQRLRQSAIDTGSQRAVAFAVCVAGEAELLAGNLAHAESLLTEAVERHRELLADTGLAHSLQRLAEVRLAAGDRSAAQALAREALTLARWSPLSRHLLQRTYGTLIAAATDLQAALHVVDEAAQVLDDPSACIFCQVMIAVPSAIVCAEGQRFEEARRHLAAAELSAMTWQGTAWQGAVTEARACLVRAEGDDRVADELLARAAQLFDTAGQPIDAERCRDAITA